MGDGGPRVAEVGGDGDQLRCIHHTPGGVLAALDVEGHDRAGAFLLPLRQRVLGMRGQPGVIDALDYRLLLEPLRELQRRRRLRFDAHPQRLQPPQYHPRVERAHRRPGGAEKAEHALVDRSALAQHRAAQHPALPVEKLGRRMDHDIRAEIERALQDGRAEDVVHREQRPRLLRDFRDRRDVVDLHRRVRRGFQEQELRIGLHRFLPCRRARAGNERGLHPEALEDGAEELDGRAEYLRGADDVVARLQQAHRAREDRRHAGRGGDAALGALQRGEPPLERAHRGIGETRIDIAGLPVREALRRLRGRLEHEARREEQRIGVLAELAALGARPHRQGFQPVIVAHIALSQ